MNETDSSQANQPEGNHIKNLGSFCKLDHFIAMAKFVYSYEMVNLTNNENLNLHPKVIYKTGYRNIFLMGKTREY